jgi:mannose-1-phosphate guanylyltransferase
MAENRRGGRTWAIVLAGGDGRRLHQVSVGLDGRPVPKQYCGFGTGRSLLQRTLARAERVASPDCVVTVVDRSHHSWWPAELDGQPLDNIMVQPANRGTAAGVLLPLVELWWRDPDATVVILPSDHGVRDEEVLGRALSHAVDEASRSSDEVVLLGMTPSGPETGYGWIVPDVPTAGRQTRRVRYFFEKPDAGIAEALFLGGALWSSFLVAGRLRALLDLYRLALPQLLAEFLGSVRPGGTRPDAGDGGYALHSLYGNLDTADFSRHVLEAATERLRVMAVPPCGWSDLGTPERLAAFFTWMAPPSIVVGDPAGHRLRGRPEHQVPEPAWSPLRRAS